MDAANTPEGSKASETGDIAQAMHLRLTEALGNARCHAWGFNAECFAVRMRVWDHGPGISMRLFALHVGCARRDKSDEWCSGSNEGDQMRHFLDSSSE